MIEALTALCGGSILAAYLWAASTVGWPLPRTAAFVAGNLALLVALAVGDRSLAAHMVEHGLVVAVAAPLLILGGPVTLALKALTPAGRGRLLGLLRSRPVGALTQPLVSWSLFVATQWVVHLSPLLEASESRPALHAAEHALLLFTALLFWAPVLGPDPLPHKLRGPLRSVYLFAAAPAVDLAAAIFIAQGHELAGAMMLASMLPIGAAGAILTWSWMSAEQGRVTRREAAGASA